MIQYLLELTKYDLKHIADLSDSPLKSIRSIYFDDYLPTNFLSELQLVKLYQIILEIQFKNRRGLFIEDQMKLI
jgi:hypothetical protein